MLRLSLYALTSNNKLFHMRCTLPLVVACSTLAVRSQVSACHGNPSPVLFAAKAAESKKHVRFRIIDKLGGAKATGRIVLRVALFDQSDGGDIDIFIDGQNCGQTNYYMQQGGFAIGTLPIETNSLKNGMHQIEVADSNGNRDAEKIDVLNAISQFDFDPVSITSNCVIRARLSVPQWWRLTISGEDDRVVRQYYGYGSEVNVVWTGRDANGHFVSPSIYPFSLVATKSHSKATGWTSIDPYAIHRK